MTCWWNWIEWSVNVRIQAIVETAIHVDDLQATESFYGTIRGARLAAGKVQAPDVVPQVGVTRRGAARRRLRVGGVL
jgi:hypothetical protein